MFLTCMQASPLPREASLALEETDSGPSTSNAVEHASLSVPPVSLQPIPAPALDTNASLAAPDQELIGRAAAGSAAVAAVAKAASPKQDTLRVRPPNKTPPLAKEHACWLLSTSARSLCCPLRLR